MTFRVTHVGLTNPIVNSKKRWMGEYKMAFLLVKNKISVEIFTRIY
jgi:hypothetical protein